MTNYIKKFVINEFMQVRLVKGKTRIYMKSHKGSNRYSEFRQCMFLMFNILKEKIPDYDHIDSIDQMADLYKPEAWHNGFNKQNQLSSTEAFKGHCSNLQAWYEYGYDTRILKMNLAFPLLKRLAYLGDKKAKEMYKQEITERFLSNHFPVQEYLLKRGYMTSLSFSNFKEIKEKIKLKKKIRLRFYKLYLLRFQQQFENYKGDIQKFKYNDELSYIFHFSEDNELKEYLIKLKALDYFQYDKLLQFKKLIKPKEFENKRLFDLYLNRKYRMSLNERLIQRKIEDWL